MTSRKLARWTGLSAAALLLLSATVTTPALADEDNSIIVYTGTSQGAAANAASSHASALIQRAREEGKIRVIAGLRTTLQSEDGISPIAQAQQTASLRTIQNSVLSRVLGSSAAGAALTGIESPAVLFDYVPYVSLFADAAQVTRLLSDPAVVSVQEDRLHNRPGLAESVPLIRANEAWPTGANGYGYVVAVIDTGTELAHPMFAGKIVSEACYSTTSGTNVKSLCPKGVASSTAAKSSAACTFKGCDHGTHVAGIAVGNATIDGVAREARLISIQMYSRNNSASSCGGTAPCLSGYDSDIIKGIERVYALRSTYKIASINLSTYGGKYSSSCDSAKPAMRDVMKKVKGVGIAVVNIAGNNSYNGFVSHPGCISHGITVGSTTKTDGVSAFSNHSNLVRLMAPGQDINSAVPGKTYKKMSGTSMAAPHVAGAFAVLRDGVAPASTVGVVDKFTAALACTGVSVMRNNIAKPRIDVKAALDYLKKPPANVFKWPFTAKAEVSNWTQVLGKWGWVTPGYMRTTQTASNSVWNFASVPNCYPWFTVEVKMRRASNNLNGWHSGMFLRANIDAAKKDASGLWFAWSKKNGGGVSIQVWRLKSYDMITDADNADLLCDVSDAALNPASFLTLKVTSSATKHEYYINNKKYCTVTDSNFTAGATMVGMLAPHGSTEAHKLELDQVAITPLGTPAELPDQTIDPMASAAN